MKKELVVEPGCGRDCQNPDGGGTGEGSCRVLYTWPGAERPSPGENKKTRLKAAFLVHNNKSFSSIVPFVPLLRFQAQHLIQIHLIDNYSFATSPPRLLARTTPSWQVTATSVPPRLYNYCITSPVSVQSSRPETNTHPSVHHTTSILGPGTHHLSPVVSANKVNVGPHG